jgi:uncharacterized protein YcbK (DUF882 family)
MHGMSIPASVLALIPVLALAPATASASTHASGSTEEASHAAHAETKTCSKPSVEVVAGPESATFALERCDGELIPASVDKLSVLARAEGVEKPKEITSKPHDADVAPGIRRLDGRIVARLEQIADHFRKEAEPVKIVIVSSKSRSAGSYHASGRAIDFRVDGVEDEEVAAFCKTMKDTGCGFYPNGGFVHVDARDEGAGHVAWIDISKRGDAPKYVSAWPVPSEKTEKAEEKAEKAEKMEAKAEEPATKKELPSLPAAVQAVPMETPKAEAPKAEPIKAEPPKADAKSEPEATPAPKKHHRHHHHSRTEHTI